jgi:hypothetical protein
MFSHADMSICNMSICNRFALEHKQLSIGLGSADYITTLVSFHAVEISLPTTAVVSEVTTQNSSL